MGDLALCGMIMWVGGCLSTMCLTLHGQVTAFCVHAYLCLLLYDLNAFKLSYDIQADWGFERGSYEPDLEMDSFSDHASDAFASSDSMDIDESFEDNFEAQSNDHQCKNVLDPYLYVSPRYFSSFDRETYRLMEIDLQGKSVITIEMIKSHDTRGLIDLKTWFHHGDPHGRHPHGVL